MLSKLYLFLGKFRSVFLWDVQSNEFLKLLLFNGFNLSSLILYLLSDLPAFLQVVKSLLLGFLVIRDDLGSQLLSMPLEHFLFLFLNPSFLFFDFLLLRDDPHELISLLLSLLSQSPLPVHELLLSGLFKVSQYLLLMFKFLAFLLPGRPFTLFKGPLRPQRINFRLSILSLLLQLPQSLNFSLFLLFDPLQFSKLLLFSKRLLSVIIDNFHLQIFLIPLLGIFDFNGAFVGFLHFSH